MTSLVSRINPADTRLLLASLIVLVVAIGQVACTPRSGSDPSAAAPDAGAQQAFEDNVIELEFNRRLIDDGLGAFKDVNTVVFGGRVLLIGSVDQSETRERAGALAEEIDGVHEVINEIQVDDTGGIGAFISDVIIEKSIQSAFLFDDAIDSSNFRVRTVNGAVYMIGRAASRLEYDRAAAVVNETDNVKRVVNYVEISPE